MCVVDMTSRLISTRQFIRKLKAEKMLPRVLSCFSVTYYSSFLYGVLPFVYVNGAYSHDSLTLDHGQDMFQVASSRPSWE